MFLGKFSTIHKGYVIFLTIKGVTTKLRLGQKTALILGKKKHKKAGCNTLPLLNSYCKLSALVI